ncbi:MAG: glycine/D-amino acid oxidase-like deaminating enzyme [Paraglaciecola sp.]|jgi:glycine/D-amino acid oxidase-like deaminating enzyme
MYDPFTQSHPLPQQGYPNSYWAADVIPTKKDELDSHHKTDIAIIGAGYTGLSAAYHLAKKYNANVTVIEANDAGWGCSGRNAGFVLPGTGRLSLLQMRKKWGNDCSQSIFREFREAIDTVKHMIELGNIDCDLTSAGYLKVAHKQELVSNMKTQALMQQKVFGDTVEFCDSRQIGNEFMSNENAFGGIYYADYFSLNPLKLAHGYERLVSEQGVKIYCNSPVIAWHTEQGKQQLITPKGRISCDKVIIATNGYTAKNLHPIINNRHMPVLSSVIVTRQLSQKEQQDVGLKPGLMVMDTRALKYYYRLLPDGRLLFGGRGAIKGKDADKEIYSQRLLAALKQTFPQLNEITIAYFWSGWVSVSFDDYPRIWGNQDNNVFYAMGYCGSGLSFAAQAGKRLAQKVAGDSTLPSIPYMQSSLPKFPLPSFRRVGLSLYYKWAQLKS